MRVSTAPNLLIGAVMLACCFPVPASSQETEIRAAAAANLSGVLEKIAEGFIRANPGSKVELSFGSSGALAAQIRSGAPFDLFLSADVAQASRLASEGRADGGEDSVRPYAVGVLCVASRHGVDPAGKLDFLSKPEYKSIAVARPELAPYGAAAVAALEKAGLAPVLRDRLVYGTNIGQVVQFVGTGAADAGFVNLSAVLADPSYAKIPWAKVDPALYPPIEQALVVLKQRASGAVGEKSLAAARAFAAYVLGSEGVSILLNAGYAPPAPRSP